MLRTTIPSLTTDVKSVQAPLFFRSCTHGISQLADALIDFFNPHRPI